jgi:hypothetical protein
MIERVMLRQSAKLVTWGVVAINLMMPVCVTSADNGETPEILGRWRLLNESRGFSEGKRHYSSPSKLIVTLGRGPVTVRTDRDPKEIDYWVLFSPHRYGIYRIEDDKLTVLWAFERENRATRR